MSDQSVPTPFDRVLWRQRRNRLGPLTSGPMFNLHRHVATELTDRLELINRRFSQALILSPRGIYAQRLIDRPNVDALLQVTSSELQIGEQAPCHTTLLNLVADEEHLPFPAECVDLVIGGMTLHWANDLVGTLIQIRRCLKPDGLFVAAMFGGETLTELRECLAEAEIEVEGGLSPRVAPMCEIRLLGSLLQRAQFALPVADVDRHRLWFASPLALMSELRHAGESNVLCERRTELPPRTLARACDLYRERYSNQQSEVYATFDVVYLYGWAPHESQQQPLRPGAAKASLAAALGTDEISLGEKAAPDPPTH